ncbi:hypothetical protein M405DRAFT_76226 [Rhizopogon salebrosus TDB-379]|nr:hypothetical protein M405DRAFT_76226 [Rhizopogon salebrosus TDB-379]
MALGPYTFLGPLWWQALNLASTGLLGPPYVFSDLHTTATHAGPIPDLSLSGMSYTIISARTIALDPLYLIWI